MIGFGVPAGTKKPLHNPTTTSGTPASAMVGTSGSSRVRFAPVTASARSLPACTCAVVGGGSMIAIEALPETTPSSISPLLL